jgi:TPR repeat protein
MRTFFALLLLITIPRPASADFVAAEAAMKRGEYPSAYLACKSEADAGDAECQHLVGYLYQEGLGVPLNATEAIRLFRRAAKRGLAIAQCHLGFAYERAPPGHLGQKQLATGPPLLVRVLQIGKTRLTQHSPTPNLPDPENLTNPAAMANKSAIP